MVILITAFVSVISEWFRSDLYKVGAVSVSKEMRYDLYVNYFQKCSKLTLPIDKEKSQKYFNFKTIEDDLETFERHLSYHQPLNQRNKLLLLAYLVLLFVVSWVMALVALGGLVILAILQALTNLMASKAKSKSQSNRSELLEMALSSFHNDQNKYNQTATRFSQVNDKMFIQLYKDLVVLGGCKFLVMACIIIYSWGLVILAKEMYTKTSAGTQTSKELLQIDQIVSFAVYYALFLFQCQKLGDQSYSESKKATKEAQSRIFTIIKLQPMALAATPEGKIADSMVNKNFMSLI